MSYFSVFCIRILYSAATRRFEVVGRFLVASSSVPERATSVSRAV